MASKSSQRLELTRPQFEITKLRVFILLKIKKPRPNLIRRGFGTRVPSYSIIALAMRLLRVRTPATIIPVAMYLFLVFA